MTISRRAAALAGMGLLPAQNGSVDILVRDASPGAPRGSNWLPAPSGKFILTMRLQRPKEHGPAILDGN